MSIHISQETVTPEMAAKYLAANTHNRNLVEGRVTTFKNDIVAGRWALNGDTIKFSDSDVLLDGQHRLAAVVAADKPITTLVVRGLESDAQDTMDTGAKRTLANALTLAGEHNVNTLAAGVRIAWYIDTHGSPKTAPLGYPSNRELLDYLEKNPGLRDSALLGVQAGHSSLRIQSSIATGLHYLMSRLDQESADTFWNSLLENDTTKGDAIFALRESLTRDLGRPHRMNGNWKAATIIKAWNYWLEGRSGLSYVMWRGGGSAPEPFPALHAPEKETK